MTTELMVVLGLLGAAIVMFAIGRPRMDAVALLMLTVLPFTGVLTMTEALAGFADANVVLIATLFIIGEGLLRTGVVQRMGDLLIAKAGTSSSRLVVLLMLFVGTLGAVMSSTGVVAIFIPVVMRVAQLTGAAPSGLMMPLSVAALSSGMLTLVATAPNLVVNSELVRQGLTGFHFFSFTPVGTVVLLISVAYMLVARRLLTVKPTSEVRRAERPTLPDWIEKYGLAERELRLRVTAGSSLVGRPLDAIDLRGKCGAQALAVERAQGRSVEILDPTSKGLLLSAGDVLLVDFFDRNCDAAAVAAEYGLETLPLTGAFFTDRTQELGMAEALVGPDSDLVGRTVQEARFRTRYRLSVVGLRHGSTPQPVRPAAGTAPHRGHAAARRSLEADRRAAARIARPGAARHASRARRCPGGPGQGAAGVGGARARRRVDGERRGSERPGRAHRRAAARGPGVRRLPELLRLDPLEEPRADRRHDAVLAGAAAHRGRRPRRPMRWCGWPAGRGPTRCSRASSSSRPRSACSYPTRRRPC